jgi:paraquat-inducible protein B
MSKKASPTLVGLFIIVGLALAIAGVLVFSSGGLFRTQEKYILYFNVSLKGLDPGAPVKFRGVTIGKVLEVLIRHNQSKDDFAMPVIIAIDTKLTQRRSDEHIQFGKDRLGYLIQEGFRARLDAESLVTGVLYIGMERPLNPPAPVFHQLKPEYPEIPTMPSQVQQLLASLDRVDLGGISEKLNAVLTHADTSLGQLNVAEINAGVTNLLGSANRVVTTPDLTNSFTSFRRALSQAEVLLKRVDGRVDPLADSVTNTLFDAQKTLAGLRVAVRNVADLLSPDSAIPPDLQQTLEELSSAGRAIADLAGFLERNPNALLAGKKIPKEQR